MSGWQSRQENLDIKQLDSSIERLRDSGHLLLARKLHKEYQQRLKLERQLEFILAVENLEET